MCCCIVNLDWWESFWVARRRLILVFSYTGGRLMARMLVVVCAAVVTNDVWVVIWALVALETLRVFGSFVVWRRADRSTFEPPVGDIRRQQLIFCVPLGLATVLYLVGRNLGNVVIVKYLGAAALAQFTIGTYGEPIILALRNSISQVVLLELVRLGERSRDDALALWYRTTVINCLLLFPVAAIVAWYAEPLVLKTFGAAYRPAIPVLQWYALVIVRSCFDFAPLLRAINKTRPFITSCAVTALANALTLVVLLPAYGIVAAAVGLVVANFAEAAYLALCVKPPVRHRGTQAPSLERSHKGQYVRRRRRRHRLRDHLRATRDPSRRRLGFGPLRCSVRGAAKGNSPRGGEYPAAADPDAGACDSRALA